MVTNLQLPKSLSALKRVNATDADFNRLETFVTKRTNQLFELLSITGKEEANNFLSKDPESWEADASYQKLKDRVQKMKVVNDSAERGIALIEKYNECLQRRSFVEGRGTEAVPAPFCPAPQTAVSNLVQPFQLSSVSVVQHDVGQLRHWKVGKDNVETADCHFSCCYALICLL